MALLDGAGVRFAEAVRGAGEELAGEAGDLVEQPREIAFADHDEFGVGLGHDGGVAGSVSKHGKFSEPVPGPECRDRASVAAHPRGAVEDDEELVAVLTLVDDGGASGHVSAFSSPRNLLEVFARAGREQREVL